jgi:hypothetical protein
MRPRVELRGAALAAVLLCCASAARADEPPKKKPQKQTPQEKKRQQLLDELGLQKVEAPSPPPPTPAPPPSAPEEPATAPTPGVPRPSPSPSAALAPPGPSFRHAVHPLLMQWCQVCHRAGGPAGATHLVLVGDAAADFPAVRALVAPAAPATSPLLVKSAGQMHGGGAPWPADGDAHARVLAWITKGARLDGGPATAPAAETPAAPRGTAPRVPAPRPAAAPPPIAAEAPGSTALAPAETPAAAPVAAPPVAAARPDIHDLLTSACAGCHNPRGPAAATHLLLSGDPAADEEAARALVDRAAPARSPLVTKASGELHGGGVVLWPGDPRLARLTAWAEAVAAPAAPAPAGGPRTAAVPGEPPAPRPDAVTSASRAARAEAAPGTAAPHAGSGGLLLPAGFFLNGRFDLNYERQHFNGNPWADGSTAALRSYHHFLFLSRESASDPFGLSIEILTLQFWEAHARLGGHGRPWRLLLSGGKILVPFGADPLVHQSYGGLAGFDQRILPPVWAEEGFAAHFGFERRRFVITDDAYVVRGYALPRADAVLNLQNDFSTTDDVRLGWGNRLGVAWFCASAWYSAYVNALGFGRLLFMQAGDLTIARPRPIPVLGHFSAGAGLLRADVSGGGAGLDYYHFGSYFQLRYHPTDWLLFQYRQGLRTYNNRRGLYLDETRLGPEDMSTHNFAAIARYRGLTFTLAYFLLFEKAGEIPNDFLRASVAYDF